MARAISRRRRELELQLLAFELTERRFALVCRAVLLAVILVSATAAVICALHGHSWQTSSLLGGPGVASSIALAAEIRRAAIERGR
jgi:Kef-type K+ transport system membrane component KefB